MTTDPFDNLRDAIQIVLNHCGDGWNLSHYVVAVGLERLNSSGVVESTVWIAAPIDQADYITSGLLESAVYVQANADIDDEED